MRSKSARFLLLACLGALALAGSREARAATISFDAPICEGGARECVHGDVLGSLTEPGTFTEDGITFSVTAENVNAGRPDLAVIFDSRLRGTRDRDLEFAKTGNLAQGRIVILQENDIGGCARPGDICDEPDDEGERPAGTIGFDFSMNPLLSFGFDLLDVEDDAPERMGSVEFEFMDGGTAVVQFSDLRIRDSSVMFGDNSANRIEPFTLQELRSDVPIRAVTFNAGGSLGIDHFRVMAVPEPGTALLIGLGLAGLALQRRRA